MRKPAISCGVLAAVSVAVAAALGPTPAASAAWSTAGSGTAAAAAATMPVGGTPSASAVSNRVTVSWVPVTLSNGAAVAGYVVSRYSALNGAPAVVEAGCSGVVTTTTCTELSVGPGSWIYTETPVELNWSGGQSPASASVTVPLT